ncbi:MAG: o-succinylbenzoate synthase [Candidatus Zixiibacteriota bacterium]|nr:MAG: o-succinylbenzoate synthase [candidate division Zixibacteria bacterium]
MIIKRVRVWQYSIPLRTPLITAQSTIVKRRGLIVRAETDNDLVGYGEIAPLDGFSRENLEEARQAISAMRRRLEGQPIPPEPSALRAAYVGRDGDRVSLPSVLFGIETLLADLAAQTAGVSLSRWCNPQASDRVPVNAILSGSMAEIKEQLSRMLPLGYQAYKLKVGVETDARELKKIAYLREKLGDGISIRLDANRVFGFDQAVRFLTSVAQFKIEYIEEPLRADQYSRLSDLRAESQVPIALDESLSDRSVGKATWSLRDRTLQLADRRMMDVVIIKPMLAGGLCEVLELARELSRTDVKMVISSAIETGVGLTAALHLAASLSDTVLPCGLDTLGLLADSLISEPLPEENGCISIPTKRGLGISICDLDANPYCTSVI